MKVYFAHSFDNAASSGRSERQHAAPDIIQILRESHVDVIDPSDIEATITSPSDRFEKCLRSIRESDCLLTVADDRLGMGVGAEMMYARLHSVPVVLICPKDSYYRSDRTKGEIQHAFLLGLSTSRYDSIEECLREMTSQGAGG